MQHEKQGFPLPLEDCFFIYSQCFLRFWCTLAILHQISLKIFWYKTYLTLTHLKSYSKFLDQKNEWNQTTSLFLRLWILMFLQWISEVEWWRYHFFFCMIKNQVLICKIHAKKFQNAINFFFLQILLYNTVNLKVTVARHQNSKIPGNK